MTTKLTSDIPFFFLAQEDLYRLGNANAPRLDHVRGADVDIVERNGIKVVLANRKGISLFTVAALNRLKGGWLWKVQKDTEMPLGLGLYNDHGAHYMICPTHEMPLDEFKALLFKLASLCIRVGKG